MHAQKKKKNKQQKKLVDLPWLLLNSQNVAAMIEGIQRAPLAFRAWAAIPVYLALAYLVSKPNSRLEAFAMGLCVYAVYDWTNMSTFSEYSWGFAIGDTCWGGFITSIVFTILTLPRWRGVE